MTHAFNELKNSIELIKKYLTNMIQVSGQQCSISPQWIDQQFLKQNNPHVFLQLMHYTFVQFSPSQVFLKVLDQYPTIKDDSDKKFISSLMLFARKTFQIDLRIDVEQFLSQKFVERKAELVALLTRLVYEMHTKLSGKKIKATRKQPPTNKIQKNSSYQQAPSSSLNAYISHQKNIFDDQDLDEQPRIINIQPKKIQVKAQLENYRVKRTIPIKTSTKQQQSSEQQDKDIKELLQKKKLIKQKVSSKNKANDKDLRKIQKNKSNKQFVVADDVRQINKDYQHNQFLLHASQECHHVEQYYQPSQQQQQIVVNQKNYKNEYPQPQKNKNNISVNNSINKTQPIIPISSNNQIDYVSREQFMQIIHGMNKNFCQLIGKFNQFQEQVSGWVNNVNAKMSILQENIKTIKDNI